MTNITKRGADLLLAGGSAEDLPCTLIKPIPLICVWDLVAEAKTMVQLLPRVMDCMVVHELAPIKVPDHSENFWKCVGRVMPDIEERRNWLKKNGGEP